MEHTRSSSPESGSPESEFDRLQKMVRVNRQTINRLKERLGVMERALELVCDNPQMQWLYRNRNERMDATVPMFAESRARFHLARYQFAAGFVSGKVVADIACGTGYGCRLLRQDGNASRVTGVDICTEAIAYARACHGVDGVAYYAADATNCGLGDQSVDCLVSFETIEHVADATGLLTEFHRILKPGGLLICSTPNSWPLEIAPHHVREYDRASFVQALAARFAVESLFNQNSGSDFRYNHGQAAGIIPTTDENYSVAECFIAVAKR